MKAMTAEDQKNSNREVSSDDLRFLRTQEQRIEFGFLEVADALYQIKNYKDGLLYADHGNFADYVRQRFGYQKQYGYRLLNSGEFINKLRNVEAGAPLPLRESQVRPILALPEEHQVPAWQILTEKKKPEAIDAKLVRSEVQKYRKKIGLPLQEKKKPSSVGSREMRTSLLREQGITGADALRALADFVADHPNSSEIFPLIRQIRDLMGDECARMHHLPEAVPILQIK